MSETSSTASRSIPGRVNSAITRTRTVFWNVLFVLFVLLILALWVGSCQQISVPDNAALVLNPEGIIVERTSVADPFEQIVSGPGVNEVELHQILRAIELAAQDERITLLALDFDELLWAAPAHAERIGYALSQFKASGKDIVAYGYFFDQASFQMASFANEVYLHPLGQVGLFGFGNYSFYFKELLEKFKVNVHVFRVGEFKSAVEPFTRTDMSPEARMANAALYDTLWQNTVQVVADNRQLDTDAVQTYANQFDQLLTKTRGDIARAALEQNLVDELLTDDQARVRIGDKVGLAGDGNINGIGFLSYLDAVGDAELNTTFGSVTGPSIAVLPAQGVITNAKHNNGVIGAQATIDLIRQVRRNPDIKALVVRVDSPGGSQFASELIRQELELVQLAGKPVVASFGASAASGGYWISATSDHITAERSTITGSIGIFALTTTFEQSLKQLGVYTDGVGTSPLSQGIGPFVGLNDEVKSVLQSQVEHGYRQFVELVARGRHLEVSTVEGMAQGRVWSGEVAHELGLVDSIGGLEHALSQAAELADLTDFQTVWLTEPLDPRQLLMQQLLSATSAKFPNTETLVSGNPARPSLLTSGTTLLGQAMYLLNNLNDPNRLYALCEMCEWRSPAQPSADVLRWFQ